MLKAINEKDIGKSDKIQGHKNENTININPNAAYDNKNNEFCHYVKFNGKTVGIKANLAVKPLVHHQYVSYQNAFVMSRAICHKKKREEGRATSQCQFSYFVSPSTVETS